MDERHGLAVAVEQIAIRHVDQGPALPGRRSTAMGIEATSVPPSSVIGTWKVAPGATGDAGAPNTKLMPAVLG